MDKKIREERLYERISLPIKVNYEVCARPHDLRKSISKNIGGGGICLSLTEKLLPTTELYISITLPKTKSQDYNIKGKVVWARKIEVTGGEATSVYYDTGIMFLDTNPVMIGRIVSCFYGREL